MKKYIVWGLVLGAAVGAAIILVNRKKSIEDEFSSFFDSALAAEDLLGDAFVEVPDRP